MDRIRIPWVVALAVVVAALPAAAQLPALRTLARPDAEYPRPFISIVGVRELADGRVIVADSRGGTLQVIDFVSGAATPVTPNVSGHGNVGRPGHLLPLAGDTTAMFDASNHRFLLIGPDGRPAGTAAAPSQSLGGFTAGDTQGRVYGAIRVSHWGRPTGPDSAMLVRYAIGSGRLDTIAVFPVTKYDVAGADGNSGSNGNVNVNVSVTVNAFDYVWIDPVPFAVHDDWAAFPDGRVAVVRGNDYHVDFYGSDGLKTSGPPTPFVPLPVTDADKEAVRAARRPKPREIPQTMAPPDREPSVWYPTKAPFTENGAWAGPDGELWVATSLPAGDASPKFDVFDERGVRRTTVVLPAGVRVIGFGAHAVYAVRNDAHNQQFLERFDLK